MINLIKINSKKSFKNISNLKFKKINSKKSFKNISNLKFKKINSKKSFKNISNLKFKKINSKKLFKNISNLKFKKILFSIINLLLKFPKKLIKNRINLIKILIKKKLNNINPHNLIQIYIKVYKKKKLIKLKFIKPKIFKKFKFNLI
jgi:hypothetical protein